MSEFCVAMLRNELKVLIHLGQRKYRIAHCGHDEDEEIVKE